jgi:hypothetical protein
MTRFFRPNGSALLTLVAALLLATWPFFGTFTIGTLVAGFFLSMAMRSWYREHPSTVGVPHRPVHSEINLASIPVRGDGGGALFAAGSVVILLALPQLRWFLIASMASALVLACALIVWRHHVAAR